MSYTGIDYNVKTRIVRGCKFIVKLHYKLADPTELQLDTVGVVLRVSGGYL